MKTKKCTKCGKRKPATTKYFHKAKSGKFGLRSDCKECVSVNTRKRWRLNSIILSKQVREYRLEYKSLVISHYGGHCAVCGETCLAFLCIDHIHGGGRKHRKEIGNCGASFICG